MKKSGFIFAIMAALAMVFGSVFVPNAHAVDTPEEEFYKNAEYIAGIFDEHNSYRRSLGLKPFKFSPDISLRISQPFNNLLAENDRGNEIWHNEAKFFGQGGIHAAENVASAYGYDNPAELFQRWVDSKEHQAILVDPEYKTIAISYAAGDSGAWAFSTVNFYNMPTNPGVTYSSGAEWLEDIAAKKADKSAGKSLDVYTTEGNHEHNGRKWRTKCEPYSSTERCKTEIWSDPIRWNGVNYNYVADYAFNNLTYLPSTRETWKGNPLGGNGEVGGKVSWKDDGGRDWRTECDTPATGRGACRSYVMISIVKEIDGKFVIVSQETLNNIVLFTN